jgi:hypothetical protein
VELGAQEEVTLAADEAKMTELQYEVKKESQDEVSKD